MAALMSWTWPGNWTWLLLRTDTPATAYPWGARRSAQASAVSLPLSPNQADPSE